MRLLRSAVGDSAKASTSELVSDAGVGSLVNFLAEARGRLAGVFGVTGFLGVAVFLTGVEAPVSTFFFFQP
jgi:hypothetical protein